MTEYEIITSLAKRTRGYVCYYVAESPRNMAYRPTPQLKGDSIRWLCDVPEKRNN
jgi:hypothetical protein